MKNKGTLYHCAICQRHTTTYHEVFFGSLRKKSEKFNIQIPICIFCHSKAHGRKYLDFPSPLSGTQEAIQRTLCGILMIDYRKTKSALMSRFSGYLDEVTDQCAEIIRSYEV